MISEPEFRAATIADSEFFCQTSVASPVSKPRCLCNLYRANFDGRLRSSLRLRGCRLRPEVQRETFNEAQHRSHSHHPYRQPAAAGAGSPSPRSQAQGRGVRSGSHRCRADHGHRRGGPAPNRSRRRHRRRRRVKQNIVERLCRAPRQRPRKKAALPGAERRALERCPRHRSAARNRHGESRYRRRSAPLPHRHRRVS